jgi:hypothetical protein
MHWGFEYALDSLKREEKNLQDIVGRILNSGAVRPSLVAELGEVRDRLSRAQRQARQEARRQRLFRPGPAVELMDDALETAEPAGRAGYAASGEPAAV